jgi:hypothetical protein
MGAKNLSGKTIFHQLGNKAGMIDMRMRKNQGINVGWIKTKTLIQAICVPSHALEHTAVEQNFAAVLKGYEVFGAGYSLGGAMKSDLHPCSFPQDKILLRLAAKRSYRMHYDCLKKLRLPICDLFLIEVMLTLKHIGNVIWAFEKV